MIVRGISSTVLVRIMGHESSAITSSPWKEGCFSPVSRRWGGSSLS
jgi:hypothetical protein